jgi:hypothetical protein
MKQLLLVWLLLGCADSDPAAPEDNAVREASEACDRACLIRTAQAVFERPELAKDARFTENGRVIALKDSWLAGASAVQFHNTYADERAGQVMIVGTAQSQVDGAAKAAVFGLRAKIRATKLEELELLVASDGEASLFPPSLPVETDARYDETVPEGTRDDADTLIKLADRYFDGIQAAGDPGLPVAEGCNRVENGVQTTRNPRFNDLRCNTLEVFVYIPVVEQRRFPIIDEARGVVAGIVVFQIPGGDYEYELNGQKVMRSYTPRSLYLFEAFKISDGVIQQIEATMRNLDYGAKIDWPID